MSIDKFVLLLYIIGSACFLIGSLISFLRTT